MGSLGIIKTSQTFSGEVSHGDKYHSDRTQLGQIAQEVGNSITPGELGQSNHDIVPRGFDNVRQKME